MTKVKGLFSPRHKRYPKLKALISYIKTEVAKSIRLQILFATGMSLILATFSGLFVQEILRHTDIGRGYYTTYKHSKTNFEEHIIDILTQINSMESISEDVLKDFLETLKQDTTGIADADYYLADKTGNLIYHEDYIERINLIKVIQKVNSRENLRNEENIFLGIYPITLNGEICYLYIEGVLEGQTEFYYTGLPTFLGLVTGIGVFIFLIFKLTKQKIDYIEYLSFCLGEISKGNLSYNIDIVGEDELAKVAKDIMYMEQEIKRQIDTKLHAEKLKNELVTNVAHDLRTPLTSVIGYIGLVKNKKYEAKEDADKYIDIAYNKAESLRILIEDLFELTKLHQKGVPLSKETVSMTNLIGQLVQEFMPVASDNNIDIKVNLYAAQGLIEADIPKITRVLENLINNAIKYSQETSCIYIELKETEKHLFFAISNKYTQKPNKDELDRLFDRFYRTDESRNSQKGGSGLGLAIAKEIIALHGGVIKAKLNGEYISFMILLPKSKTA